MKFDRRVIGICCASDGSSVILRCHQLFIHWESGRSSVCMIHTNDAACQTCTRVYWKDTIWQICPSSICWPSVEDCCVCEELVDDVECMSSVTSARHLASAGHIMMYPYILCSMSNIYQRILAWHRHLLCIWRQFCASDKSPEWCMIHTNDAACQTVCQICTREYWWPTRLLHHLMGNMRRQFNMCWMTLWRVLCNTYSVLCTVSCGVGFFFWNWH